MFCLNENIPCNRDVLAVFIYLSTGPETVAGGSDVGRSQDVKGVEENLKYSRYRKRTRRSSLPFLFDRRPLFYQREKKRALSYSDANE